MTYTFTPEQLNCLLLATIKMFVEYRDIHGKPEEDGADLAAIDEMFQGLDGEQEMAEDGAKAATMQVYEPWKPVAIEHRDAGDKIAAIRACRERTGWDLATAKAAVEAL